MCWFLILSKRNLPPHHFLKFWPMALQLTKYFCVYFCIRGSGRLLLLLVGMLCMQKQRSERWSGLHRVASIYCYTQTWNPVPHPHPKPRTYQKFKTVPLRLGEYCVRACQETEKGEVRDVRGKTVSSGHNEAFTPRNSQQLWLPTRNQASHISNMDRWGLVRAESHWQLMAPGEERVGFLQMCGFS